MPVDLGELLHPSRAALLMMECQEGIIGGGGTLNALADAVARHGIVERIATLLHAARRAQVPVFHCTMARRPDGGGAVANCLLLAAGRKGTPLLPGSPQQAVVTTQSSPVSRRSTGPSSTRSSGTSASGPSSRPACR